VLFCLPCRPNGPVQRVVGQVALHSAFVLWVRTRCIVTAGVVAGGAEHYLEIERDWYANQPIGLPKLLCVMEVCVTDRGNRHLNRKAKQMCNYKTAKNNIKRLCIDTFVIYSYFIRK